MPIYEFECQLHGVFEDIFPITSNVEFVRCPQCKVYCERIFSLCNMHPDTMWAGYQTRQGYFTSKSDYNKVLKAKNLETLTSRSDLETVRKNVVKAKKDKKEKQLNNLIKHLTNDLKGVTIDPDGNTLKETKQYVRARNKSTD
jgi:putative FmdB family regulatory protein